MRAYWSQLNERERGLVLISAVLLGLYLLYALVYEPLVDGLQHQRDMAKEKKATLLYMQDVQKRYPQTKQQVKIDNSGLLTLLTHQLSLSSFKRFTYQLEQTSLGEVQLTFDTVPYDAFLSWLVEQAKRYSLQIKQFSVEKTDTPGLVKMKVVMDSK